MPAAKTGSWLARALALSLVVHVVLGVGGRALLPAGGGSDAELVDVELAPEAPPVEALPEEKLRQQQAELAAAQAAAAAEPEAAAAAAAGHHDEEGVPVADAAVPDAAIDARPPDAAIDARPPDAAIDARPPDAAPKPDDAAKPDAAPKPDAAIADAMAVAVGDDASGSGGGSEQLAAGSGSDQLAASSGSDQLAASSGSGQLATGSGSGQLAAGSGSDQLAAGSGSGQLAAGSGSDQLAAGSGSGQLTADRGSSSGPPTADRGRGSGPLPAASGSDRGDSQQTAPGFALGSAGGSDAETAAAVDGAPTTAGTAANLLAYFPQGHVVTALVRFDRLRGSEWAELAEKILRPLPDYQVLFDPQSPPHLADKLDTLVISSPAPRDVTATTLVAHTRLSRVQLRALLTFPVGPKQLPSFSWSNARGGMLGHRAAAPARDKRVVLAPFRNWFVLAQRADLGTLTTPAPAPRDPENLEAPPAQTPAWLANIRTIEAESGDPRGPALVVTLGGSAKRYKLPDLGLGVDSIMTPTRASIAAELVKQGWLVRGNIVFASPADAAEFVTAAQAIQQRISDSHLLQLAMRRSHALNALLGLQLARTDARVSYATSLSIADARALLAVVAATLAEYYGAKP